MAGSEFTLPQLDEEGNVVGSAPQSLPAAEPRQEREYSLPKLNPDGEVHHDVDYGNMPWSEVGSRALGNFKQSAYNNLTAIPEMVMNPVQTYHAMGDLAGGVKSKVAGLFTEQDPAQKKRDEALLDATIEPFTSVEGFKKTLAEDPVSITSALAAPFTGGAGAGVRVANALGKGSKLARVAGRVADAAIDPAAEVGRGLSQAVKGAGESLKNVSSKSSGAPVESLEKAYEVNAMDSHPFKTTFETFASGAGDAEAMSKKARDALEKVRRYEHDQWAKNKALVIGGNDEIPLDLITRAIDDAESKLGNSSFNTKYTQSAYQRIQDLRDEVAARSMSGGAGNSAKELDIWKQLLWDAAHEKTVSPTEASVLDNVRNGVRDTLATHVPDYVELMRDYDVLRDGLNNITKTLGTGDKVAANREMMTLMRQFDNDAGRKLIERLAQHEPELPYMISGAALSNLAPEAKSYFLKNLIDYGAAAFGGHGLLSGDYITPLVAAGTSIASHALQSPSFAKGAAELSGKVANKAGKVAAAIPQSVKETARRAGSATKKVASPAATNIKRGQFDVQFAENRGGRIKRQSGGRIVRSLTADQLISGLERARNRQKKTTEPILNQPDEAVVRALDIANKHI